MDKDLITLLRPRLIHDLIRIGGNYDGGYFIKNSTIEKTKVLIGLGIFVNWKFEEEFNRKKDTIITYLVDASVSNKFYVFYPLKSSIKFIYFFIKTPFHISFLFKKYILDSIGLSTKWQKFSQNNNTTFLKKFLSTKDSDLFLSTDTLFDIIKKRFIFGENDVFVKMDIEGSEYDVLKDFKKYYFYINSFAIEFHDVNKNLAAFTEIIADLKQEFDIVFVHNNNFSKMFDSNFTESIEITLVKKNLIDCAFVSADVYKKLLKIEWQSATLQTRIVSLAFTRYYEKTNKDFLYILPSKYRRRFRSMFKLAKRHRKK